MKIKNKIPAALLSDNLVEKTYQIEIKLSGNHMVLIQTTDKDIAQQEFNRAKAAGIYSGRWIDNLELREE